MNLDGPSPRLNGRSDVNRKQFNLESVLAAIALEAAYQATRTALTCNRLAWLVWIG